MISHLAPEVIVIIAAAIGFVVGSSIVWLGTRRNVIVTDEDEIHSCLCNLCRKARKVFN